MSTETGSRGNQSRVAWKGRLVGQRRKSHNIGRLVDTHGDAKLTDLLATPA
jgi:hypothetical protein